jgi:hypothetical protein
MRYDDAVCRFEMWYDLMDMEQPQRFVARIARIDELLPAASFILPANMQPTNKGLATWLARQRFPRIGPMWRAFSLELA